MALSIETMDNIVEGNDSATRTMYSSKYSID